MVTFPTFWQLFRFTFLTPSPTRHELAEAGWSLVDEVSRLKAENAALHMANKELVGLMSEMVEMVEEEISNREGRVSFEWECPHCEGATPMPCSLGCKVKNAIFKANKAAIR